MKKNFIVVALISACLLGAEELKPFGHWPINEGEGTVIRSTSGEVNGKLLAGDSAEWITHGDSKALLFKNPAKGNDLTRIAIPCADFDPVQGFSVLVTVKTPEVFPVNSRQYEIVNFTHAFSKPQGFRLLMAWKSFWFHIGDGSKLFRIDIPSTKYKLATDTWYKIAAIYDGQKAAIYLNGVKMAEKDQVVCAKSKNKRFMVGCADNRTYGFDGAITNLVIYPGAISEEVIHNYCQKE